MHTEYGIKHTACNVDSLLEPPIIFHNSNTFLGTSLSRWQPPTPKRPTSPDSQTSPQICENRRCKLSRISTITTAYRPGCACALSLSLFLPVFLRTYIKTLSRCVCSGGGTHAPTFRSVRDELCHR